MRRRLYWLEMFALTMMRTFRMFAAELAKHTRASRGEREMRTLLFIRGNFLLEFNQQLAGRPETFQIAQRDVGWPCELEPRGR